MEEYTDKVLDHFDNPRNLGFLPDADGVGEVGSRECGDYLVIYIKVNDKEEIEDIKFRIRGCVASIATSSAVTEMAKGKHIYEALDINELDIIDYLEGLPENKIHCSVLGAEGLRRAIYDYLEKRATE